MQKSLLPVLDSHQEQTYVIMPRVGLRPPIASVGESTSLLGLIQCTGAALVWGVSS